MPRGVVVFALCALGCGDGPPAAPGPGVAGLGGEAVPVPDSLWYHHASVLSAHDAVAVPEGWVVLDTYADQLHRLAPSGALLGSFAREGDGPGELRFPEALARVGDTVWVVDARGSRADGFTTGGAHVRRLPLAWRACAPPRVTDVVARDTELWLLVQCAAGGTSRHLVRVDTRDGRARVHPVPGTSRTRGRLDAALPRLVVRHGALFVGTSFDACLRPALGGGAALCQDSTEWVALPPAERDSAWAALERRTRQYGLELVPPPHRAFIDDVFVTRRGVFATRPDVGDTTVLVRIPRAGRPSRARFPTGWDVHVSDHGVLVAERVVTGTRFALLPLPGAPP